MCKLNCKHIRTNMVTTCFPGQGEEKLREIEEIMNGAGAFNENFDLTIGDIMVDEDDDDGSAPPPEGEPTKPPKKVANPFPNVDGEETMEQFVGKYKKTMLSRRGVFRTLHDQWTAANPPTGKCLNSNYI